MPLSNLTEAERAVVGECLRAAVAGQFFPEWEFATLFGLTRVEVADIAYAAGGLDDAREEVRVAINNAMNMLTGYPHRRGKEVWERFITVPPAEVRRILTKWKGSAGKGGAGARDVFDEMM